ncbi:MAG: YceI family protein [Marinibacterium sp.]|nr:YceI family protein [Marinibacterium sp.]
MHRNPETDMTQHLTRRHLIAGLAAASLPLSAPLSRPAHASPARYRLDPKGSSVGFVFYLNDTAYKGTMPVSAADIVVDPQNLRASRVDVSVSVDQARTGLVFATEALKGASVLDAARHPRVRFVSRKVNLGPGGRLSDGASLDGDLTLRGVTRPLRLTADVFRTRGSAANDLSALTVHLRGALNRSAFGATGYSGIVQDRILLDITAAIRATG